MTFPRTLVLVINSGSSSLKFAVLPAAGGESEVSGLAECLGLPDARLSVKADGRKTTTALTTGDHVGAIAAIFDLLQQRGLLGAIAAVGHRVVHGGERFGESVKITPEVLADIEAVSALAPLHNPANLIGIRSALARLPDTPQVAVFDTAFHQMMPPAAFHYAIPQALYRDYGVRRYGFHGTSHRYVAAAVAQALKLDPRDHGIVVAHLGNGASATAVLNGRSVDTTMGLTPLEGLVMGTRSGDVDIGAVAHIARITGRSLAEIETLLNKESGLLGLSGLSSDMRGLEAAAAQGHAGALLAIEVFVHRLARHIGGLATSLSRLDAVAFTGGIGENSAFIRALTVKRLAVLGMELDETVNAACVGGREGIVSRGPGPVAIVMPTDEERLIAADAARIAGLDVEQASDSALRVAPDACPPSETPRSTTRL
jgi:acetate kinase